MTHGTSLRPCYLPSPQRGEQCSLNGTHRKQTEYEPSASFPPSPTRGRRVSLRRRLGKSWQDRRKPHASTSHCAAGVDSGKLNNRAEQLDGATRRCCWKSEPNRAKPPFQFSTKRREVSLPSASTLWMMHGSKNADTVAYTSTFTSSRSSLKIFLLNICFNFNLLITRFIQTR